MSDELKQTPFSSSYPDGVVEWIDIFGYAVALTWGDPNVESAKSTPIKILFIIYLLF